MRRLRSLDPRSRRSRMVAVSRGAGPHRRSNRKSLEPLAVIGIGCRFPGARDPAELWTLIRENRVSVGEIPDQRWDRTCLFDPSGASPQALPHWRGGFIDGVEAFDWRAFGMLPREARHLDPQHRLVLELSWEALEDAGLPLQALRGHRAGVFVGIQWNDYARLLARDWSRLDGYSAVGNDFGFAANRVSYAFGFQGPSLAVSCGCASALAAVQLACQSLWAGDCDMALAAGVELILAPESSLLISALGVTSKRGESRTLDARADGFVRSEGAGVIVLKPVSMLDSADRPYALLRGIALNHNGRNEWISAPNADAQRRVIRDACRAAHVDPRQLDYVELHAPGHSPGDAVELGALLDVVQAGQRGRRCLVGSLKPNVGHMGCASAMGGLIKVALALHHRTIPPSIAPCELHPHAVERQAEFTIPTAPAPWPRSPARTFAGVTAISLGGANAHAVLSTPAVRRRVLPTARRALVLPLSAASRPALVALADRFVPFLRAGESAEDICFTAGARRSHYVSRLAVTGRTSGELADALESRLRELEGERPTSAATVLWRFGDACGADRVKQSALYHCEPVFRATYRQCERDLAPALRRSRIARLFCAQLACTALWRSWGVPCHASHGIGAGRLAASYTSGQRTWKQILRSLAAGAGPDDPGPMPAAASDCVVLAIGASLDHGELLRTLGEIYERGIDVNWQAVYQGDRSVVSLPTYAWQRELMWPARLDVRQTSAPPSGANTSGSPAADPESPELVRERLRAAAASRQVEHFVYYVRERLAEILGTPAARSLDSLSSHALSVRVTRDLGVSLPVSRVLQSDSIENIASYLCAQLALDVLVTSVGASEGDHDDTQEVVRL